MFLLLDLFFLTHQKVMNDPYSVSTLADVSSWVCKQKRQGKIIALKRARDPTTAADESRCPFVVSADCGDRTPANGGLSDFNASRYHLITCSNGGAQAISDCVTLNPSASQQIIAVSSSLSYSSSVVIGVTSSGGVTSCNIACGGGGGVSVAGNACWGAMINVRRLLDSSSDIQHVSVEDKISSRLAFASDAYFDAIQKRLIVELLTAAAHWTPRDKSATKMVITASVESMRQHHPALHLLRASSLWELVLEPLLTMPEWFFQLNEDTIAVSDSAAGVPLLNVCAFFEDDERRRLVECETRLMDAATLTYEGGYQWRALSCLAPLKKLMNFPLGALRNVISSSMNKTLVDEVLEIARLVNAIRQAPSSASRRADTTVDSELSNASGVKWEEVLRAYVPDLLRPASALNVLQNHQDEIENVCIYIGVSCGMIVADESNASRNQRKSTHAKASLMELFAGKLSGGLPPFGAFIVKSSPIPGKEQNAAPRKLNDDDLLDGLFDDDEPDSAHAATGASTVDASKSLVDVVVFHNTCTNDVDISYRNDQRFEQRLRDIQQRRELEWDAVEPLTLAPCSFCSAATHAYLHQCPWFLSRALQLQRLQLSFKHLRVDPDKIEEDPNLLPGASDLAQIVAPQARDDVTEAVAVRAALNLKHSRRREKEKQMVWEDLANDVWSSIQIFVTRQMKAKLPKLKAQFMERVALRQEIHDVESGIEFIKKCVDSLDNFTNAKVEAAFRKVIESWMRKLTQLYS
jgi:hypothetical protein